jgi:Glyoxalase-like domain
MAVLADIVFDCVHPASVARFWADVLDGYEVAPYDDPEIERLRAMGIDDIEDDPTVLVTGPGPRFIFQRVPEPKTVKNRVHLDLRGDVAEFVALGATVFEEHDNWTTLQDPEGNEFCVLRA